MFSFFQSSQIRIFGQNDFSFKNLNSQQYVLRATFGCWPRRRPPWLPDKFMAESGCSPGSRSRRRRRRRRRRKESEKRVKSKLQKCNSPTRSAGAAGGKANTIRGVFRIFTMSTSTRGCNNCSFSAKKMHFGAKREVLRRGAMGCHAMQCWVLYKLANCREGGWVRVPRVGSNGDGSLRSDSNVIWPALPNWYSADLQCRSMMWYPAGCQLQPGIAVSRQKYRLTAHTPHNASLGARVHLDFGKGGMLVIRRMWRPAVNSHWDPKSCPRTF